MSAYWYSNLLVDYVKYLIPAFFTIMAILAYDVTVFLEDGAAGATVLLFILFGFGLVGFTYLTSFMFTGPSSA